MRNHGWPAACLMHSACRWLRRGRRRRSMRNRAAGAAPILPCANSETRNAWLAERLDTMCRRMGGGRRALVYMLVVGSARGSGLIR